MGFVLIWILIGRVFNIAQWLAIGAVITLGIDLGFWIFEPQLEWYVGLSGVLHGVLAAGIVASVRAGRIEIAILGVGLIAKLIYEQAAGPLPGSEQTSGGAVIIAAHAYGALAGAVAGGLYLIKERRAT
jgi:rhomboid family GlyGly-CTERM serine protease